MSFKPENIGEKYIAEVAGVFENNLKLQQLQLTTIKQMNDMSQVQYGKNLDKIKEIKEEQKETSQNQEKLLQHFGQVDKLEMQIEGMESSVEYLDVILQRIEDKLGGLQQMPS